jgi:hypothetical protein
MDMTWEQGAEAISLRLLLSAGPLYTGGIETKDREAVYQAAPRAVVSVEEGKGWPSFYREDEPEFCQ